MTHHLEAAGDVLEDLGHILTHLAQPIAAAGATCGRCRLVRRRRARQMLRQLATALLLASFGRLLIRYRLRRGGGRVLSLVALQLLELQLQLLDLALDALRRGAKRHPLQTRELELELLGFQRFVDQTGLGRVALGNRSIRARP